MESEEIARILGELKSERATEAWAEFLQASSPLILHVIQSFQRDADSVADCYLYICEQLCRNNFRRLLRFRLDGSASFATWLRVVVHNLCRDWRRREYGRERLFESIARLPALNQDVFRRLYEQGLSASEAVISLRSKYPQLTGQQVEECHASLLRSLNPRQLWLLSLRRAMASSLDGPVGESENVGLVQVPDGQPDPEKLTMLEELRSSLASAVGRLESQERLLIRLRFEQGLTLQQVAKIAGLPDAQTADRRIKAILGRLKQEIG
ncbi:MAG: sigma-70 family RNA polymerase sigma factor [Acidobacteria bacterium]|nr:sigma-70 family RNA polymerase sigma factor [Acidobacteriota bacterium]